MRTHTAETFPMIRAFVHQAKAKAEAARKSIAIVLAPAVVVVNLMNQCRAMVGKPALPPGEVFTLQILDGVPVFGVHIAAEAHPYYGTITAWASDDIDIAPACPLIDGKERPDEADAWEHTLWGCQMEEWLANMHEPIGRLLSSGQCEPVLKATLLQP